MILITFLSDFYVEERGPQRRKHPGGRKRHTHRGRYLPGEHIKIKLKEKHGVWDPGDDYNLT